MRALARPMDWLDRGLWRYHPQDPNPSGALHFSEATLSSLKLIKSSTYSRGYCDNKLNIAHKDAYKVSGKK